ncbi:hypothetical protein ACIHCQ_40755 [Streptomyces sp. NPDC052236]|uniref:hypothetical protein n=1 Tax=Streptomyces sp. NPDC052236 TaxID=3365686 RepID=UPI0037CD4EDA
MTASTSVSTPDSAERRAPRADCIADSAGGLTFDLAGAGAPDAVLVLKRRGSTDPADETRLPLTPSGEGTSRAVLPSTVELAEGHWDVYTDDEPVEPGSRDLRALVDRAPDADRVAARVPYPTAGGHLTVRSWLRAPHAEAGDIGLAAERGAITVEGMLYGAELAEGAVAEARLRTGDRDADRVHAVPVRGEGRSFGFTLTYGPMAEKSVAKEQLWELWLRPAADAPGIRISRILDDIWDKKGIFVYPRLVAGKCRAAACYTSDNDLCVRITVAN